MIESVYLHIPFCSYKCPYCDFLSVVENRVEEYLQALKKEIELYSHLGLKVKTVYFGGGTPTLLEPSLIGEILSNLTRIFPTSESLEVTVECNPETYGYREFKALVDTGVNRLSIGVQSFTNKGLSSLGRKHSVSESIRAVEEAFEAGIRNINVDLIYAYPSQKEEDAITEIEFLSNLPVTHVSAYMLTAYDGTPMGKLIREGRLDVPDEEELEGIYRIICDGLKAIGFRRYEISNWAREGFECLHNLNYWRRKEFLGLGVSAWGFIDKTRYGNTRNLNIYIQKLKEGVLPVDVKKYIGTKETLEEEIFLGLRLTEGIDANRFKIPHELSEFLNFSGGRVSIREEYMLLADEIIAQVLYYNDTLQKMRRSENG